MAIVDVQAKTNDQPNDDLNCLVEYFCEMCGHYPLIPMHGHFECPQCRYKTKCCEGMALDIE